MTSFHPIYRFSPIENAVTLENAIEYVAKNTVRLAKTITGEIFPLGNLTIFSHYDDEFKYLSDLILEIGTKVHDNNGPFSRLDKPLHFDGITVETVRIRTPDPYRLHVGCADLFFDDYIKYRSLFPTKFPKNIRCIDRPTFEMLEFFHSDFDVLAYMVQNK